MFSEQSSQVTIYDQKLKNSFSYILQKSKVEYNPPGERIRNS